MGTHAVNPRNSVKLGEGRHKFNARLSYTANPRPTRVLRPCPERKEGYPNENKAFRSADTRDVPASHLPLAHLPGTDANEQ